MQAPEKKPRFISNPDVDSRIMLDAANRLEAMPSTDLVEARERIAAKIEGAISALTSIRERIGDPAAR
jgi:hypothetical protein